MGVIKRFGVLKMAGFMGLYSAFIGLVFGILFFLLSFLPSASLYTSLLGISGGALSIIILPLIYGVFGFVGGLIFTPIMNLALKITKGINFSVELGGHTY